MLVRPACLIAASAPTVGSSKHPNMAPEVNWFVYVLTAVFILRFWYLGKG